MKFSIGVLLIATSAISFPAFGQQPAAQPASGGEVIGVIQWLTVVADLDKAEQFYHGLMGLESLGGDPRMRLTWYPTVPFLTEMYNTQGNLRNFTLRIPGTDMGVEPVQWSEAKGKLQTLRLQDPGAAYLILKTWNLDAMMARIAKGGAQVLTSGGKPVVVDSQNGKNKVVWLREPNGFFVELEQPDPPPPAPGANGAPAASYYTGANAGFAVNNLEKTVQFYRDILGFQAKMGDFSSNSDQLNALGLKSGQYRTAVLSTARGTADIRLMEFKGIDRKPLHTEIIDPNALVLRMRARGIDALADKLKASGTKIVSVSGAPYANGPTRWFMAQGPDNVFIQLTEAPASAPNPGAPALPR